MKKSILSLVSLGLVSTMMFNLTACSISDVWSNAESAAESVKLNVSNWYENLDFSEFESGWDSVVQFAGSQYSAALSSSYINDISTAISNMKIEMNASANNARGTAQEAGFLAEEWATDTFNINAIANGSSERATTVHSTERGSVDVTTTYGENASLKYYRTGSASAAAQAQRADQAQAQQLIIDYKNYCVETEAAGETNLTFKEYLDFIGYSAEQMDQIMASEYAGRTRIIPTDQMNVAVDFLQGRIDTLTAEGIPADNYVETLNNLKDRLQAPDGTTSEPVTYDEMQAITELCQSGEFDPEDFGISVSQVISPKYILKTSIGTGLTMAAMNTAFTVAPDVYSLIRETAETGNLNEEDLSEIGLEGVVAGSEGFVEGSVSCVITTLAKSGKLGTAMKSADANLVAALTIVVIQAAINGYKVANGEMSLDEYGNLTADNLMITILSLGTTSLILAFLPTCGIMPLVGSLAGSMIACAGYTVAKTTVLNVVDGGGFEAIVPDEYATSLSVDTDVIESLDISDSVSSFGDTALSTLEDGRIQVEGLFND